MRIDWQRFCKSVIFVRVRNLVMTLGAAAVSMLAAAGQTPTAAVENNLRVHSSGSEPGILWRDPGDVARLDFAGGPGGRDGAPAPPFSFQEEASGGTAAKILVTDANKRVWEMKWGEEAKPESFATRLLWAAGYFVEPAYFVRSGKIENVGALGRASTFIDRGNGNSFTNARFELRDPSVMLTPNTGWFLNRNPFVNSNELQGLKIMAMLVSNWDLKDPRAPDGSNTMIVRVKKQDGSEETRYLVNDWGATMGKWGGAMTRSKWDCKGYAAQNKDFLKGVRGGTVRFGYEGKLTDDVTKGVTVENVRWLMGNLGKITDEQLRTGLAASGANESEMACYVGALRERIELLRKVSK